MMQSLPQLNNGSRRAILWALPASILASTTLFLMLAQLTSPAKVELGRKFDSPELDFLLLRKDSELEVLNRERLPEPETVKQLDTPKMQPMTQEPLDFEQAMPNIAAPDIAVSVNIDMSPALSNLGDLNVEPQMFATGVPFVTKVRALKRTEPRYPPKALRRGIEARVLTEFVIDAEGYAVSDTIKILKTDAPGVFDKAVKRAIKRSRFEPYLANGVAVSVKTQLPFSFRLPKKK